jgi:hypothetical protein
MEKNNKQPEANLILRFADAEHLLKALKLVPEEEMKSVTHQNLVRHLTLIRDNWLKIERERKARKMTVLRNKAQVRGQNGVSKNQGTK